MRILIVEDNQKTAAYLSKGLKENGFTIDVAYDGKEGLFYTETQSYELIILDVMLPELDGWDLIQAIRVNDKQTPILFLTAKDEVEDRVKGLELGADDYLIKPFAFSEFLARVRTLVRRKQQPVLTNILEIDNLKIDLPKHCAIRNNERIPLTAKEFMLLALLAKRKGEVLSRTFIAEQVWDINFDSDTNVVDVAIRRLRQKVDDAYDKKLIHTVRGMGYYLDDKSNN